ncbi:MAG TPA: hypothetical protein VHH52_06855, partial [Pseudonocardiaceae bacterium]|nr:hypothetical protein [Pseudonocardiaceae bacterium]
LALRGQQRTRIHCESIRAKKGKRVRAEPVAAQYGQGNVSHVGTLTHTEDQICVWTPEKVESPDRMDGLVYAVLYLSGGAPGGGVSRPKGTVQRHSMTRHMIPSSAAMRRSA